MEGREFQAPSGSYHAEVDSGSRIHELAFTVPRRTDTHAAGRRIDLAASVLTVALAASVFVSLVYRQAHFTTYSPTVEVGLESASALARLFGAVVLFLFPWEKGGQRLHWVAAGLTVLGLGGLVFGFLGPLFNMRLDFDSSIYASGAVRTLAGLLFAVGLVPRRVPVFARTQALMAAVALLVLAGVVLVAGDTLPTLARVPSARAAAGGATTMLPGLTTWHWALSLVPLALAVLATAGAARAVRSGTLEGWILLAMLLLTGSQIHAMFWPSAYSPLVTTADLLRLAFALLILLGSIDQLRRGAAERTALLAEANDYARRLTELGVLKSHFTAMVAHELGNPLAAIRLATQMLETGELGPAENAETLQSIRAEADILTSLVADVGAAATVERDDFEVRQRLVPLIQILADATTYARRLPGNHPIEAPVTATEMVWADPERIGQVLRNLLSNAAKYSLERTPIEVHVSRAGRKVRISVVDHGYGIHPDDMARVFEKFGRGRDQSGNKVRGIGLGLYLSRRIMQAHGSDLTVESVPGAGSTFGFELEGIL